MSLMQSEYEKLKHGSKAPDFKLKGVDGKVYSLASFKERLLLVIIMCNHCPYVKAKFNVINALAHDFKGKVAVIGINPNNAEQYPDDSFENMQKLVNSNKFEFYYLHDETQETAKDYGAVCTPDPFLFDADRKLVYHGRLDDAISPDMKATNEEMRPVIESLLSDRGITIAERPSMGCSIKWK
jgi:peroxiredoxin